jgi:leader peptidase (prepilin peptidase)/N-methyltransferase
MDSSMLAGLVGAVLGLVVGSFLNVLIHRLPRMMERSWAQDVAQWQAQQDSPSAVTAGTRAAAQEGAPYDLARPRSHCTSCGHTLRWYENIPVISFLVLRARCSACGQPISWRYPLVELATAALWAICLQRWGLSPMGGLWCGFSALLLALALIDQDTQYLPDDLTQPLLWAGLLAAALAWNPWVSLDSAVWGAAGGYLSLWAVYHLFKWITGKEGMGQGDFKLLAALGAWFGVQALLPLVLIASVAGAAVGLGLRAMGRLQAGQPMPFGPYLALAGFSAMLLGPVAAWPVLGGWAW